MVIGTTAAIIGSSLISAGVGAVASNKQGKAQTQAGQLAADSTKYAADLQNQQFNRTLELQKPGYRVGQSALGLYSTALGLPGFDLVGGDTSGYGIPSGELARLKAMYGSNTAIPDAVRAQPGYQAQLDTGINAAMASAAARGTARSGRTLAGLADIGQRTFGSYYDSWLNRVGGLAGRQTDAASSVGQAGQTAATNIGNLAVTGAQAQGQAGIGAANAWAQGAGGITGALSTIPYWMKPGGGGGSGAFPSNAAAAAAHWG